MPLPLRVPPPCLPHLLDLLTVRDGPVAPEGDLPRFVAALATSWLWVWIVETHTLSVPLKLLLWGFAAPELVRRLWLTFPHGFPVPNEHHD